MIAGPIFIDHLEIDPTAFIAPQAYVRGTVRIGAHAGASGPWSVIRGDKGAIVIGARTNVQDQPGSALHADPDAYLTIGSGVTIGHGAIVHGCTVGDDVLIGMGVVILNHAPASAWVAWSQRARSSTEGMIVPPGSVVIGIPAKDQAPARRPARAHSP